MALPPDRSHIATEQPHQKSAALDTLRIEECIDLLIDDHRAVIEALRGARDELGAFIEALVERVREGGRLIYIGAGTSGRLGVLDASECPPTFQADPGTIVGVIAGGDTALRRSSEGMEDDRDGAAPELEHLNVGPGDTVLGIAAGGTTPYVLGGLETAKNRGAATALLTSSPPATPPPGCDRVIVLETGPEVLTGSTRLKAGSAAKLALNIITTTLFIQLGKTYGNLMVDLRATNHKLADRAIRIIRTLQPQRSREDAAALLASADGDLKCAILMGAMEIGRAEARARLGACDGRLRDALGELSLRDPARSV